MKIVTDPELIAELENASQSQQQSKVVTDPQLIAELEGTDQMPGAEPSISRTVLDQALQGATFNFSDEAAAGIGALYAKLLGGEATANKSLGELYDEAKNLASQQLQAQQEANPVTAIASQLAGGVLTGGAAATTKAGQGLVKNLATGGLPVRMLKGAAVGAGSGAVAGAGAGEEGNRLESAGYGAGAGAALGGAIPAVTSAVKGGVNMLRGKTDDLMEGVEASGAFREAADVVKSRKAQFERDVSKAFTIAKDKGRDVIVAKDGFVEPIKQSILKQLDEEAIDINAVGNTKLKMLFNQLNEITNKPQAKLNDLEMWRRKVTRNLGRMKQSMTADPDVKEGLERMLRSYDTLATRGAKTAILSGDENAVKLWRDAIGKRREMANIFQVNKKTGQVKIFEDIINQERLTNEQLSSALAINNKRAGIVAQDLINAAGPEGNLVRRNIANGTLLRAFENATDENGDVLVPRLRKEIGKILGPQGETFRKSVFAPEEVDALRKFNKRLEPGVIDKALMAPLQMFANLRGLSVQATRRLRSDRQVRDFLNDIIQPMKQELRGEPIYYGGLLGGQIGADLTMDGEE